MGWISPGVEFYRGTHNFHHGAGFSPYFYPGPEFSLRQTCLVFYLLWVFQGLYHIRRFILEVRAEIRRKRKKRKELKRDNWQGKHYAVSWWKFHFLKDLLWSALYFNLQLEKNEHDLEFVMDFSTPSTTSHYTRTLYDKRGLLVNLLFIFKVRFILMANLPLFSLCLLLKLGFDHFARSYVWPDRVTKFSNNHPTCQVIVVSVNLSVVFCWLPCSHQSW